VVKKFIDPAKDAIPAKCKLKIPKSTEAAGCNKLLDIGGYKVQPVPTPPSINVELNNKYNDDGNNQKLRLFNLGKAISGAPK